MVTDFVYGRIEPYKLMALKVVEVPTSAEYVVPEVGVATGAVPLLISPATAGRALRAGAVSTERQMNGTADGRG
jgi:hypothetical protein